MQTAFKDSYRGTWLEAFGYCTCSDPVPTQDTEAIPSCACDGPLMLYVATVYWTSQIISGLAGWAIERELFSPSEQCVFLVVSTLPVVSSK